MKSDMYSQNVPYNGILITNWQYIISIYYVSIYHDLLIKIGNILSIGGQHAKEPTHALLTH